MPRATTVRVFLLSIYWMKMQISSPDSCVCIILKHTLNREQKKQFAPISLKVILETNCRQIVDER